MSETASATISFVQLDATDYQYNITLDNTGTTTIGTFWFAWDDLPDQNFLTTKPTNVTQPTNWIDLITQGSNLGPSQGFGIQYYTLSPSDYLQPGNSFDFSFQSTDAPSAVFGTSAIDSSFATASSFVYQGLPLGDAGFNFAVTPACFRGGTRIRTTRGDVAVEQLRPDDLVLTIDGNSRPLVWLGKRRIDCRRHPVSDNVWPVRIARDAFAPGMPIHDLDLSPDHAVFVDGMLFPVKCLVNGTTIEQVAVDEVTYYHVELDRHDVLLAEGLAVESYLDTGDRGMFTNGGGPVALHPDFAPRMWEAEGCAALVVAGPALARVRQMLEARARLVAGDGHEMPANPIVVAKRRA